MTDTSLISGQTVRENTPYPALVTQIADAFRSYHEGTAVMPEKLYVDVEQGDFRAMPAHVQADDWAAAGIKWVNVHPENDQLPTVMGIMALNDPETGFPLALMNGTELTGRRTGAAAAVATNALAAEDASTLGIVGAGAQSFEQVAAISSVRDIEQITVAEVDDDRQEAFVRAFEDDYTVTTGTVEAATMSDVVSTLTPVTEPFISSVGEHTHVNAMGADAPDKQEFESSVVTEQVSNVFVDDWEQCRHSGEISASHTAGKLSREDIAGTLGDVVTSDQSVETYGTETTLFDSTGLAIQDVAAAQLVYESIDTEATSTVSLT